jgi:hypothetical protein
LGQRYSAIASFIQQGPAMIRINLGEGIQAKFLVAQVTPPAPAPPGQPFTSFSLAGPYGNSLYLYEDQIAHIQPEGPQDGTRLFITLDNGASLELSRPPETSLGCPEN